eukprot:SM000103S09523  [mRNA]  locus=s103:470030:473187:- [translate_table: standard]
MAASSLGCPPLAASPRRGLGAPRATTPISSPVLATARPLLSAPAQRPALCRLAAAVDGPAPLLRPDPLTSAPPSGRDITAGGCFKASTRRRLALGGFAAGLVMCAAAATQEMAKADIELDSRGRSRLAFKSNGYYYWPWRGHQIHYVSEGQGEGPPIVLVHGFGASAYHWRYNIPELAKKYRVYALDLLGFGWSDKAVIDYNPGLWRDQVADFVREVVKEPAVLVGNSVGGYTVLSAAAEYPELVKGIALVNAAGRFEEDANRSGKTKVVDTREEVDLTSAFILPVKQVFQRVAVYLTFLQAKQPAGIKQVLQNVYIDKTNVDDYLVRSIVQPTGDANAAEAYYRLTTQVLLHPTAVPVDALLSRTKAPVLLLWGELDPWITPAKADRIQQLFPKAQRVRLPAGHCPHDEAPEAANAALAAWVAGLDGGGAGAGL